MKKDNKATGCTNSFYLLVAVRFDIALNKHILCDPYTTRHNSVNCTNEIQTVKYKIQNKKIKKTATSNLPNVT